LAKEIKRRTKVVAAFCKEDTVEKLLYLLGEAGERRLRGFAEIRIGRCHDDRTQ
jgi:transposase-like protein